MSNTYSGTLSPGENAKILLNLQARAGYSSDDNTVSLLAKAVCNLYDEITGGFAPTFASLALTGTAGAGFFDLPSQSADPAAPAASHIRIFNNSANKFAWIGASGYVRNFDGTLTASRTYTLPDATGTVAVSGQVFPAANGTTLLPSYTFSSDLTAGMLYAGSGGVKIATSATQAVIFSGVDQSATFSGNVIGVGATNAFNVASGVTPVVELEVNSTSTSSPRGIMSAQYTTTNDGARLHLRKARGTRAAPTTVVTGDNLGRIVGTGYDGTNYLEMASIYFASEGTIAATRVPTNIQFWTATNATPSVLTLALTLDSSQICTHAAGVRFSTPNTQTGATYSVVATDVDVIFNASGTCTVTLGTATAGRTLWLRTIAAFTVVSASSNVVPTAGGSAGTAILAATAGKWAKLVGDGTNWQTQASN